MAIRADPGRLLRHRIEAAPFAAGLYAMASYRFAASMSFANPAATFARSLMDAFAGIAAANAPMSVAAQLASALAGMARTRRLLGPKGNFEKIRNTA